jgi:hypothetical protein
MQAIAGSKYSQLERRFSSCFIFAQNATYYHIDSIINFINLKK